MIIFNTIPAAIPISKSSNNVKKIVTKKIANCSLPIWKVWINSFGWANLIPTVINIAAKAALGINSNIGVASNTNIKIKNPWKKFAHLVFAPLFTFEEERATSEIIGKPPKKAAIVFPIPTAIKSLFIFDFLLKGSNKSIAFTVNNDSNVPTKANIITYLINNPVWEKPSKLALKFKLSTKLPIFTKA